jgi:hypothetical protein
MSRRSDASMEREWQREGRGQNLALTASRAGWPTPNTPNGGRSVSIESMDATGRTTDGKKHTASLEHAVKFESWPTPRPTDDNMSRRSDASMEKEWDRQGRGQNLALTASQASWPTPTTHDAERGGMAERAMGETRHGSNLQDFALLANWPTPRAEDSESTGAHRGNADTLTSATRLASWSTPSSRDWKDTAGMATTGTNPDGSERIRLDQLPRQAHLSGLMSSGSPAATGKRGQLNPAHSRWLQGYPPEWDACAVTAMQSSRTSRPKSSVRI